MLEIVSPEGGRGVARKDLIGLVTSASMSIPQPGGPGQ